MKIEHIEKKDKPQQKPQHEDVRRWIKQLKDEYSRSVSGIMRNEADREKKDQLEAYTEAKEKLLLLTYRKAVAGHVN